MKTIIKKYLNTGIYPCNISLSLLFLRVIVSVFMLTHGYGKFLMLVGGDTIQFADPIGVGVTASLALAVFAEFFCSIFLILGLATRLSSIPLLITMIVAGLIVHAADPFMRKELPLLYAIIYTVILIAGPGKFSLDYWLNKKIK